MPVYKYRGFFECSNCQKKFTKKGSCLPKKCPLCQAGKSRIKLVKKTKLS